MKTGMTLFAQLMDFLPWTTLTRLVDRHGGGRYAKSFACTEQFRVMAFAKLTSRESLRDIEVCLSAQTAKLYHMGFRHEIKRSTLADASKTRDWRIHVEFFQCLIVLARKLYTGDICGIELENTAYALDSTTHRSVPVALSMGAVSPHQVGGEGAYATRFERQNSQLHPHLRWQDGGGLGARYFGAGARSDLRHGLRLSGLRAALCDVSRSNLLCHPCQIEYSISACLFGASRSQYGHHLRSNHCADRHDQPQGLPVHLPRIRSRIPRPARSWHFSPTISR